MGLTVRTITYDELVGADACAEALAAVGPDGLTLDDAGLARLAEHPRAAEWAHWLLCSRLCPTDARAEFNRVTVEADAEFNRVTVEARAEFNRVWAQARAEFGRVILDAARTALLAWGRL